MRQILKNIIKNIIKASGIYKSHIYIKYYRSRKGKENIQHLLEKTRKKRFEKIYDAKIWMNQPNSKSLSGNGSEIENTVNLRAELPKIISQLEITNLLDVGCGDWTWMSEVRLSCNYIGIDLVDSVIEQNINKYGASNRSFQVLDAVVDPLPTCDAILLREVIFHLSFSDIDNIFRNIIRTNPSYIFITSDPEVEINNDIVSGDFRMLNLEKKPFYLPKPFIYIDDSNVMNSTRYIGVWKVSDLRANFKK